MSKIIVRKITTGTISNNQKHINYNGYKINDKILTQNEYNQIVKESKNGNCDFIKKFLNDNSITIDDVIVL